ncbi:3-hydroxyisobutyrate dehydrogenase [Streptomyces phaeochromogenes]|uniref:3-hydroxyisobutyrate dehydrogenase n=1 Tax=Streptomyces phaeochromogenes TaxID=1923 RepID=UPI002E2D23A8|nr:3-hydroxyisobutyrate dehydrogenase [Streptomyces phaeochromogenes]
MNAHVGFVGLGHMGGPMAAHLVKAGYRVRGFDLAPEARAAAAAAGIEVVGSAPEAAAGADAVITMLPVGRHVLSVYQEEGLLAAAAPGTLFIDCSTIDVANARAAHEAAVRAGHHALDAPVSGGVIGAEDATLTFMVGGGTEDLPQAEPLLAAMGRKVVHCGPAGAGQAAKICNNMIVGISMIAVSEAFVLAESLGLSHEALYDVASTSSGQCWALTVNCPVPGPVPTSPANHDYRPGFAAPLMAKDLGLAASAARAGGVNAELGLRAAELYSEFAQGAGAHEDFSGIVRVIRDGENTRRPDGGGPG